MLRGCDEDQPAGIRTATRIHNLCAEWLSGTTATRAVAPDNYRYTFTLANKDFGDGLLQVLVPFIDRCGSCWPQTWDALTLVPGVVYRTISRQPEAGNGLRWQGPRNRGRLWIWPDTRGR
jgi:hypothetical protein